jgi:hypothetical protein
MTTIIPGELIAISAELAQKRGIPFHIENYQATVAAAARFLRTMEIIPVEEPRQITSFNTETRAYPIVEPQPEYNSGRSDPYKRFQP